MVSVVLDVRVDVSSHVEWNAVPCFPPAASSGLGRRCSCCSGYSREALLNVANAHVRLKVRCFPSILHSFLYLQLNVQLQETTFQSCGSCPGWPFTPKEIRQRWTTRFNSLIVMIVIISCVRLSCVGGSLRGDWVLTGGSLKNKAISVVLLKLQLWSSSSDHSPAICSPSPG